MGLSLRRGKANYHQGHMQGMERKNAGWVNAFKKYRQLLKRNLSMKVKVGVLGNTRVMDNFVSNDSRPNHIFTGKKEAMMREK